MEEPKHLDEVMKETQIVIEEKDIISSFLSSDRKLCKDLSARIIKQSTVNDYYQSINVAR